MGAVKNISAAWNQIIKNVVFLDCLERFRSLPERFDGDPKLSGEMMSVEFRDVWFRYPGAERCSLEAVNVILDKGEIMTIVLAPGRFICRDASIVRGALPFSTD